VAPLAEAARSTAEEVPRSDALDGFGADRGQAAQRALPVRLMRKNPGRLPIRAVGHGRSSRRMIRPSCTGAEPPQCVIATRVGDVLQGAR